jgi:hypothetical protein
MITPSDKFIIYKLVVCISLEKAVMIPTLVEHLRFHSSLKFLEQKIGYQFKNRLLLQYALTHPSGAFLLHQNLGKTHF